MPIVPTLVASLFSSGGTAPARPDTLAIVGATVIPMDGTPARPHATVIVEGGRIQAVGAGLPIPTGARVVDGTGRWLVPGLVDAHVHVWDEHDLPLFLAAGVTTVVNMSGSPLVLDWRRALAAGELTGPHLLTTGPMIDEADDPLFGLVVEVGSEADAQRVVRADADAGYDLVKLHGDIEVGLYDAVMDEAAAQGLRVVGHLSERVGLLHAMKRHQATVEHTEELLFGFFNGRFDRRRIPTAVAALRAGGAAVTPTLVSIERIVDILGDDFAALDARPGNPWISPIERANWGRDQNPYRKNHPTGDAAWFTQSLAFQEDLVRALAEGGVPLMAGTDSGWVPYVVHGAALPDELAALVHAGLSPLDALAAATSTPGAFYGGPDGPGRVAAGHPADLLLLRADPRADITNVTQVEAVVVGGHYRDRAALDTIIATAEARGEAQRPVVDALAAGDVPAALAAAAHLDEAGIRTLAMALSQSGNSAAAYDALVLGARAFPRSWSAREMAGRALLLQGRPDEALVALRGALVTATPAARALIEQEIAGAHAAG